MRTSPAVGTLLVAALWLLAMVALAELPKLLLLAVKSLNTAFCCLAARPNMGISKMQHISSGHVMSHGIISHHIVSYGIIISYCVRISLFTANIYIYTVYVYVLYMYVCSRVCSLYASVPRYVLQINK